MREHVSVRLSFPSRSLQGVASTLASAAPLSDLCSWHLITFVERGHSVRADFHRLETRFFDIYRKQTYDLTEVLASVDTPFLVYETALLAAGHVDMGQKLMKAATEAGDCQNGQATVCFALKCLAQRMFVLAGRLRL
jgi:hypothetical protein